MTRKHLCAGLALTLTIGLLAGCGPAASSPTPSPTPTATPTPSEEAPNSGELAAEQEALELGMKAFLEELYPGQTPEVDGMTKMALKERISAEVSVDVYALKYKGGNGGWSTAYLLFEGTEGYPPAYLDCWAYGERVEEIGLEQAATEALYRLWDLEFSFPRVNDHGYFGLGSQDSIGYDSWLDEGETVRLEHVDVWEENGYWYETRYEGLTLLVYHNVSEERSSLMKIETTRDDLTTYRGAKIGMTKAEILELYPEIDPEEEWYAEWGNHLAYQRNPGALADLYIHFSFDDQDCLTKIQMENYFD